MGSPEARLQRSWVELLSFVPTERPSSQSYVLLVSSPSRRWDVVLLHIDGKTGEVSFSEDSEHVFESATKATGKYLLGCAIVACNLWVLLATEVDPKPAVTLPGDHYVFDITAAAWESIPLKVQSSNPEWDFRLGEMLAEFPISGYHHFCDSADITRPFPSSHPVSEPSWEFVWNVYLTQPFREAGCKLPGICPHLLQGLAESHALPDMHGTMFSVVLLARRSRLHAGTRYKARGLNGAGGPANEIECEQIIMLQDGQFSSYVWRRGSVPLRWTQTVKSNGVGTAIAIEPEQTFRGSRKYFRRLQLRYTHVAQPRAGNAGSRLTPAQRADSRGYPVAIVNLLRKGSMDKDRSEAKLYAAFCALLTALAKECGMNVINIGLDWHDLAATHGDLAPVVQILWAAAEARYREFGFTQGRLEAAAGGTQRAPTGAGEGGGSGSDGQVTTPWGETMQAVRQRRQRGVCRFNCADSLDRTNVASYYSAFQVLLEQCRCLGLAVARYRNSVASARLLNANSAADAARGNKRMQQAGKMFGSFASRFGSMVNSAQNPGPLGASGKRTPEVAEGASASPTPEPAEDGEAAAMVPKGDLLAADGSWWERRVVPWPKQNPTGTRSVYVNHKTKEAAWKPPPAWLEWELLKQPVEAARHIVLPTLLLAYKDLFRVSGDKNAELYTGSPAMHTSQLDLLMADHVAGHGMAGFFNNAHTAVVRRMKNIITDERTHSIFERFLGLYVPPASGAAEPPARAATLAAAAHALPIADDADSDDESDALAERAWPPRDSGGSPTAAAVAADGSGVNDGPQMAAASNGVQHVHLSPSQDMLQLDSPDELGGDFADLSVAGGAADSAIKNGHDPTRQAPAYSASLDDNPFAAAAQRSAAAPGRKASPQPSRKAAPAAHVQSGAPAPAAVGHAGDDLLSGGGAHSPAQPTGASTLKGTGAGSSNGAVSAHDPLAVRDDTDLLSGPGPSAGQDHDRQHKATASGVNAPFTGFDTDSNAEGWSDAALEQPSLL